MTGSDGAGRFTLSPVPPGEHVVVAWTADLIASSLTVSVAPGATVSADIVLVTAAPTPPSEARGAVAGLVRTPDDKPVGSANIRLRERPQLSTRSANNGRFELANVPVGTHTVDAWLSEFSTASQSITVAANATVSVQLTLITVLPIVLTPPGKPPIKVVPPVVLTLAPVEKIQPVPGVKIAPAATPVPSPVPAKKG